MIAKPTARALIRLICVGVLAGCAGNAAAPAPASVAPVNQHLLLRGFLPCLDATVARVDQLHAAGAPFSGAELRTMLLARLDVPERALQMIDASKPIGFALVERPQGAPAAATAFAPRGSDAALMISALGSKLLQQNDAVEVQLPDGGGVIWLRTTAEASIVGASYEDVTLAGDEAATARALAAGAGEDLLVTAYPRAAGRALGVDLTAGPDAIVRQALARYEQAQGHPAPAAERGALEGVLRTLTPALADSEAMQAALTLGAERGLSLTLRARPLAGSAFAARLAAPPAHAEVPPQLLGAETVSVAALGPSVPALELLQAILDADARANVEGAAEVAARVRGLMALLSGDIGFGVRAAAAGLAYDVVLPVKAGADPAAALEALQALGASPGLEALLRASYGSGAPAVSARRDEGLVRADLAYGKSSAGLVKALHGASTLTALARTADGRLLITIDSAGRERLAALAAPAAHPPGEPLASALAETRGRQAVIYQDLWGAVRMAPRALSAPGHGRGGGMLSGVIGRLLGFAQFPMPVYLSVSGGDQLTAELRVPLLALKNAGTLLGMVGLGGAPPK